MVKRRTSNNYTYNMGSHVLQFGALVIDSEPVADYFGELNTGMSPLLTNFTCILFFGSVLYLPSVRMAMLCYFFGCQPLRSTYMARASQLAFICLPCLV